MKQQLLNIEVLINALSLRERSLVFITVLALTGFAWWHFMTEPLTIEIDLLTQQNLQLETEVKVAQTTASAITTRIKQGVHKDKDARLKSLRVELGKVNDALKEKTLELIGPDQMFELMLELITADSKLKLTGLKRDQLKPVFMAKKEDGAQPEIYRHIMRIDFEGKYRDILSYISRLEGLEWKLIWDKISLKTDTYPVIQVSIEISTLSDSKHWVGL